MTEPKRYEANGKNREAAEKGGKRTEVSRKLMIVVEHKKNPLNNIGQVVGNQKVCAILSHEHPSLCQEVWLRKSNCLTLSDILIVKFDITLSRFDLLYSS